MLADSQVEFVDRCYGKNYVRLLHVKRQGNWHQLKELEVNTSLTLETTKDYIAGDNSDIIATDSQKNTVYILAKQHGVRHDNYCGSCYSNIAVAYYFIFNSGILFKKNDCMIFKVTN